MKINNFLFQQDFISVSQIKSKKQIDLIFWQADFLKNKFNKKKFLNILKKYCIVELFYQPSTRTYTSFLAAASYLGAKVIPIHGMEAYSSAVKGESLIDTIRTIEQTTACDLIILRHPDNNSSKIAADFASVPIVNGGSGTQEHPTQALLDLYTIVKQFKNLNNLNIVLVGDLKYGRTTKSLAKLLSVYSKKFNLILVSPKVLKMPLEEKNYLLNKNIKIKETDNLNSIIAAADIVYVTRIQKEWFEKEKKLDLYRKLKNYYIINKNLMQKAKKNMILMHPLPRVGEIVYEVDNDPRAVYFEQMRNGLFIRMALLRLILQP